MPYSIEHPIAYYGALSGAMSACLFLFVTTARKLESVKRRLENRIGEAEKESVVRSAHVAGMETRLGEWAGRTRELEEKVSGMAAIRRPQAISTGVDSNQRTLVMRMARRGERSDQIAAELHLPRNEVDLLIKVQRAVVRAF